jgi:hypothetical protein
MNDGSQRGLDKVRLLACLILLNPIRPFAASAAESKPETYLIEYKAFRPSLYFTGNEGPDIATFTAVQSEPEWRKLWAKLEPRLRGDMRQNAPRPFPRIDFTRKTLSVESIAESPTSITAKLVALNPGKGCGDKIYGLTLITTHPIVLLLEMLRRTQCNVICLPFTSE